jgi:hypothetical protein
MFRKIHRYDFTHNCTYTDTLFVLSMNFMLPTCRSNLVKVSSTIYNFEGPGLHSSNTGMMIFLFGYFNGEKL